MNEKFFSLSGEKQNRMINAAVKVFAENGYERAGTDAIVREAGISKGLLFHYFGSKKNLYEFVTEYCVRYMTIELEDQVKSDDTNLFERIRLVEEAKLHMLILHPYLDMYLISLGREEAPEVDDLARQWYVECEEIYSSLIDEKSDPSILKKGLTIADTHELVAMCMDGYKMRRYTAGITPAEIISGFLPYLQILKDNLCR